MSIAETRSRVNQQQSYKPTINFALCQAIAYQSAAPLREKALLFVLATWVIQNAKCWPSIDSIAARARVSDRTVQLLLARLEALGELKIERSASPLGTNVYTILCALPGYQPKLRPVKTQGAKPAAKVSPEVKKDPLPNRVPVPDSVPISDLHGEGNIQFSNTKQDSCSNIPAVSPPVEIQVLESPPSQEQRQRWAREFFKWVRPEAYRLRIPLTKRQVCVLVTCMNLGELPWPKPNSWLAAQIRRPI